MPAPLSNDLRKRMLKSMNEEGLSCKATARRFGVASSTAIKLKRHACVYRTHAPLPRGGKAYKLASHHEKVIFLLSLEPDMTLRELCARLNREGVSIGYGAVFRYLEHIGMTLKKRRCLPRNRTGPTLNTDANNGKNTKAE